jgi:hypothetical protein
MAYRTITLSTSDRDRLERRIANSILANTARVCGGGIFEPSKPEDRAERIAQKVTQDILKDFRLVDRSKDERKRRR